MDSGIFEKDKFEGEGFFITFHDQPKKFDLRFMKLTEHRLNKLKLDLVDISSSEARKQFVSNFHRNNADWSMSIEHVDPAL